MASFPETWASLPGQLRGALEAAGATDPGTLRHLLPSSIDDGRDFVQELYKGEVSGEVIEEHALLIPRLHAAAAGPSERRKRQLAAEPIEVMVTWAKCRRAEDRDLRLEHCRAED